MSAKPTRGAPRLLLGVLLLLLMLAAGHGVLWYVLVDRLEAGFAAWATAQREGGRQVDHAEPARGGWPFAATVTLPSFQWAEADVALSAEAVTLRLEPLRLDRLRLEMPGTHRLRLGTADLPFTARRLDAVLPLEVAPLPKDLVMAGEGLTLGGVALRKLAVHFASNFAAGAEAPAATLHATLDDLILPPQAGPVVAALGRSVASVALDTVLSGPLAPGPATASRVAAWRDAGGALTLRGLTLRWGTIIAHAGGRFGLDAGLQPRGAATVRLAGGDAVLDAAVSTGLLAQNNAGGARLLLRLMSRVPPEGGPPELELPLTLEDRRLVLARIPLGQLPPWRWPQ